MTYTYSVGLLWRRDRPVANTSTTQHLQETDIHDPGGIRTRNPSQRGAADTCHRPPDRCKFYQHLQKRMKPNKQQHVPLFTPINPLKPSDQYAYSPETENEISGFCPRGVFMCSMSFFLHDIRRSPDRNTLYSLRGTNYDL